MQENVKHCIIPKCLKTGPTNPTPRPAAGCVHLVNLTARAQQHCNLSSKFHNNNCNGFLVLLKPRPKPCTVTRNKVPQHWSLLTDTGDHKHIKSLIKCLITLTHTHSFSSRMRFMSHNWSATKQRLHLQSAAEISRHSVLSGDRIRQSETSQEHRSVSVSRHFLL